MATARPIPESAGDHRAPARQPAGADITAFAVVRWLLHLLCQSRVRDLLTAGIRLFILLPRILSRPARALICHSVALLSATQCPAIHRHNRGSANDTCTNSHRLNRLGSQRSVNAKMQRTTAPPPSSRRVD